MLLIILIYIFSKNIKKLFFSFHYNIKKLFVYLKAIIMHIILSVILLLYIIQLFARPSECRFLTLYFIIPFFFEKYFQQLSKYLKIFITASLMSLAILLLRQVPITLFFIIYMLTCIIISTIVIICIIHYGYRYILDIIKKDKINEFIFIILCPLVILNLDFALFPQHSPDFPKLKKIFSMPKLYHEVQLAKIYDLKINSQKERLYFNHREHGVIGYINLITNEYKLSDKYFPGSEQLAIIESEKLIATNSRSLQMGIVIYDISTLKRVKHILTNNDEDFIDIIKSPFGPYLIGIENMVSKVIFIDYKNSQTTRHPIPTLFPYQVVCSTRFRSCFVDGWMSSGTLSKVSIGYYDDVISTQKLFIGPFATGMVIDDEHEKLFVSRPLASCVEVIDMKSLKKIGRIRTGPMVRAIDGAFELDMLFLPEYYSGKVNVHQISTGKKIASFYTGGRVREILWDKQLAKLFIASAETIYSLSKEDLFDLIREHSKKHFWVD